MWVEYEVTDSQFFLEFFLMLLLVSSTHLQTTNRNGFGRRKARKTWFGVRMCFLIVRSATVDFKGFTISKNCSSRRITANTKTFENFQQLRK